MDAPKETKLPEVLFALKETEGDEEYIVAGESIADLPLSRDNCTLVGTYRIEDQDEMKLEVVTK